MAEVAVELGGDNVPMSDLAAAFGPNDEETMASRKPSPFVTVCRMGAERVCVEANRRLEADVIDRLNDAAEELGDFFAHLSAGEKTMHDIERTGVSQICRGMATSEGVSRCRFTCDFDGCADRGKARAITAFGIGAVWRVVSVCFLQTVALVFRPGKAKCERALEKLRADMSGAELAVPDEFGVSSYRL